MRIDRVVLTRARLPLVRPFETSFGRMSARECVLVAVSQDGVTGWGECVADAEPFYSAEDAVTAWHVLSRFLVPATLGRETADPAALAGLWPPVRGHRMAKAALEMAAWDLHARLAGRPLCEVLGAPARPIPAGVSIGIQPSVEALVDRVASELSDGYRRVKVKIKPGWDEAPVAAVRRAFPDVALMADANAAYSIGDAEALRRLDDFALMMIEQPLDEEDVADHARLQARLSTPICLDESIVGPARAREALDLGACRIINIKPGRMGGHGPSREVHDLALERGVPLWHGGMLETGIGRAHNLHLSALPGFTLPGDVAASRRYFQPDLIEPPIEVAPDGTVAVPSGPGIGVAPVAERLRAATLQTEEFRP